MEKRKRSTDESGAILIIFMVTLAVAAIALGAAVQAWSTTWRRENEEELIFRANQYVDGIIAYRKEHGGQFPVTLEDLFKPGPRRLRYIRRLYKDPIVPDGKWGLLYLMPGGQGVYDPKAAEKAKEKAAKDWSSGWGSAGPGALAQGQGQLPGVTPIGQNPYGSGVPGTGGMPAGSMPPTAIQGGLPPIPAAPQGGIDDGKESVSEPPIGWPIIGVISRATGKAAEDTYKIYKGHEHVDEWQFHVFDRGEQVQTPGMPGARPAPVGFGPGYGGRYPIQGIGGDPNRGGPMGMGGRGAQPGFGQNNWPPGQFPRVQTPPGQYPPGYNPGQQNQGNNNNNNGQP